jgi:hypothetical protein
MCMNDAHMHSPGNTVHVSGAVAARTILVFCVTARRMFAACCWQANVTAASLVRQQQWVRCRQGNRCCAFRQTTYIARMQKQIAKVKLRCGATRARAGLVFASMRAQGEFFFYSPWRGDALVWNAPFSTVCTSYRRIQPVYGGVKDAHLRADLIVHCSVRSSQAADGAAYISLLQH